MESSAELIKWVLENLNYWVVTDHCSGKRHQAHDGDIGDERTECLDNSLTDKRRLRFCAGSPVAKQIAVKLLLAFQSAIIGIQGYNIAG